MFTFDFLKSGYTELSLSFVVTALYIGAIIALFAAFYDRFIIGNFVRSLIKNSAFSESDAKTLKELKQNNIFVMFSTRKKSSIMKLVSRTDGKEKRFFIKEELKDRAEIRYRKKGNDFFAFIFALVLLVVSGILIQKYGKQISDFIINHLSF